MPFKTALISRFESSVIQVNELLAIHTYLQSAPTTQITDNLLRAALTMMVSAIDTSVHELIINAILYEITEDKSVFNIEKVKISANLSKETNHDTLLRLIESELRKQYSKESYQSSRQIETALAQIGITKIWKKISFAIGRTPEEIKLQLDLLVRRRNQIVHEGDLDHLHDIREILREDLDESFVFTKELVKGIIDEYLSLLSV